MQKDILELQEIYEPMSESLLGNLIHNGYISADTTQLIL
jgi:hypothetical protein